MNRIQIGHTIRPRSLCEKKSRPSVGGRRTWPRSPFPASYETCVETCVRFLSVVETSLETKTDDRECFGDRLETARGTRQLSIVVAKSGVLETKPPLRVNNEMQALPLLPQPARSLVRRRESSRRFHTRSFPPHTHHDKSPRALEKQRKGPSFLARLSS